MGGRNGVGLEAGMVDWGGAGAGLGAGLGLGAGAWIGVGLGRLCHLHGDDEAPVHDELAERRGAA